MTSTIRNISQTAGEREILKTAPDIIVYLDGLPYLLNYYVNDRRTGASPTIVNFNDHVLSFNSTYDTDLMIPSATLSLSVPNNLRYLYQMPGGNNLIQPMMQIQVYAKAYFMSSQADTVYRRVFKGLVSHIGYADNGKTLEMSIQCHGILHLLELMQINLNPSAMMNQKTGSAMTYYSTKFAMNNPYKMIAVAFTWGMMSDGFQLNNINQSAATQGQFGLAVQLGYINKWQAIMKNLLKDLHIFGVSYKDPKVKSDVKAKEDERGKKTANMDEYAANAIRSTVDETYDWENDTYYGQIRKFLPERQVGSVQLLNNNIVPRIELIRKMVKLIDFECYQDVDGKIIVKPPLYNLDVLNLGNRVAQTKTTTDSRYNSLSNPLTTITPQTNPFVIYLSEILTENETEDQAAIRRTRTVVSGNIDPSFQFGYNETLLPPQEYIDIGKLIKFGLREEPVIFCPWLASGGQSALFCHAAAETVRANRAYRTYTVTIPLRPELKLGFPVFFPHKDMYGYIKSITINYAYRNNATMTIVCDSIRRRVLINTPQQDGKTRYTTAPNLVYQWKKSPGSPDYAEDKLQEQYTGVSLGGFRPSSQPKNLTDPRNVKVTMESKDVEPSEDQTTVDAAVKLRIQTKAAMKQDSAGQEQAAYYIQVDGSSGTQKDGKGYFTEKRVVDESYMDDVQGGVIPFTDEKGYELLSPFPWGRWESLNDAIKNFTESGWVGNVSGASGDNPEVEPLTDINGNPVTNPADEAVLQTADAFLYAGMATPIMSESCSDTLMKQFAKMSNTVGGSFVSQESDPNTLALDATVLVLQYDSQPQPEDAQAQDKTSGMSQQQLVDVLVRGSVAPSKMTQEALACTTSPTLLQTSSIGGTANQFSQQAEQFASAENSKDSIGPTTKK